MFLKIIIGIVIFSFLLSLWSLRNLSKRSDEKVKKELKKGRVVFYKSSSDSSDSKS